MSLKGKTAVVTGSTSGIGLGIALALAKDGCNIVVNGLGTRRTTRRPIAEVQKLGTRVAFDPANMLRHNQIADMIAKAERDFGSVDILVNNAGIQHVAPGRGVPDRAVGRHHRHQPHLGLPHRAGGGARHEEAEVGPHHQHLLGAFAARLALQERLRLGQARPGRLHQDGGARACRARRDVATPSRRASCGRRWSRSRSPISPSRRTSPRTRPSGRCCRASRPTSSSRSSRSPRWRRSSPAKLQLRSPAPTTRSMAAGPRSSGRAAPSSPHLCLPEMPHRGLMRGAFDKLSDRNDPSSVAVCARSRTASYPATPRRRAGTRPR